MASNKKPRKHRVRAAVCASPATPGLSPVDGREKPAAKISPPPVPPSNDKGGNVTPPPVVAPLPQAIAERDLARSRLEAVEARLREVEADGTDRKKLAEALTASLREIRLAKEALADRLDAAETELQNLRRHRDDLQAAFGATERDRARTEVELATAHSARTEAESLVRALKGEIRDLRREIEGLRGERDQALLARSDAVQAALASVRKTILEEL